MRADALDGSAGETAPPGEAGGRGSGGEEEEEEEEEVTVQYLSEGNSHLVLRLLRRESEEASGGRLRGVLRISKKPLEEQMEEEGGRLGLAAGDKSGEARVEMETVSESYGKRWVAALFGDFVCGPRNGSMTLRETRHMECAVREGRPTTRKRSPSRPTCHVAAPEQPTLAELGAALVDQADQEDERQREEERREDADEGKQWDLRVPLQDTTVVKTELHPDYTAPWLRDELGAEGVADDDGDVLCIELKPKSGRCSCSPFLGAARREKLFCGRYAMMQRHKAALAKDGTDQPWGHFDHESSYDPEMLLSGRFPLVLAALRRLEMNPQNNLRVSINGDHVYGWSVQDCMKLHERIDLMRSVGGTSTAAATQPSTGGPPPAKPPNQPDESLPYSAVDTLWITAAAALTQEPLLQRIRLVQSLDVFDVEGAQDVFHQLEQSMLLAHGGCETHTSGDVHSPTITTTTSSCNREAVRQSALHRITAVMRHPLRFLAQMVPELASMSPAHGAAEAVDGGSDLPLDVGHLTEEMAITLRRFAAQALKVEQWLDMVASRPAKSTPTSLPDAVVPPVPFVRTASSTSSSAASAAASTSTYCAPFLPPPSPSACSTAGDSSRPDFLHVDSGTDSATSDSVTSTAGEAVEHKPLHPPLHQPQLFSHIAIPDTSAQLAAQAHSQTDAYRTANTNAAHTPHLDPKDAFSRLAAWARTASDECLDALREHTLDALRGLDSDQCVALLVMWLCALAFSDCSIILTFQLSRRVRDASPVAAPVAEDKDQHHLQQPGLAAEGKNSAHPLQTPRTATTAYLATPLATSSVGNGAGPEAALQPGTQVYLRRICSQRHACTRGRFIMCAPSSPCNGGSALPTDSNQKPQQSSSAGEIACRYAVALIDAGPKPASKVLSKALAEPAVYTNAFSYSYKHK